MSNGENISKEHVKDNTWIRQRICCNIEGKL